MVLQCWQGVSRVMLLSIILIFINIAVLWSPAKAAVADCADADKKFCGESCFGFHGKEFIRCGEVTGPFGCCDKGTKNDNHDKERDELQKKAESTITGITIAIIVVPIVLVLCCCIAGGIAYYLLAVRPRRTANAYRGQVYTQPAPGVPAPTPSSAAYSHYSQPSGPSL